MTTDDIIKALPTVAYGGYSCEKCKYKIKDGEERCGIKGCNITRNALELINRQKAEIEIMLKPFDLQVEVSKRIEQKIKAEAIKEYRDKVKQALIDKGIFPAIVKNVMDEIAEEMEVV